MTKSRFANGEIFVLLSRRNSGEDWRVMNKLSQVNSNHAITDEGVVSILRGIQIRWHEIYPQFEYAIARVVGGTCKPGYKKIVNFV